MGRSALALFDQEARETTGRDKTTRPVERLEAKLEQLYAVAATLAQRADRMEEVEEIWARMVSICDASAQAVTKVLREQHAESSAAYDRILGIRNECEDNRALHA
jgi:hypothetical protein